MGMTYVLWNAKLGGWLSGSATYTGDLSAAKQFNHEEAVARCARAYSPAMKEFGLIPVDLSLLREVEG